jgi:hypothetical protein
VADSKAKTSHDHAGVQFVRVGNKVVNLAHVAEVDLPAAGDPKRPLTLHLVTGTHLQLSGTDAEAALEALGEFCDCEPAEAPKPEPKSAPAPHAPPKTPAPPAKKGE